MVKIKFEAILVSTISPQTTLFCVFYRMEHSTETGHVTIYDHLVFHLCLTRCFAMVRIISTVIHSGLA